LGKRIGEKKEGKSGRGQDEREETLTMKQLVQKGTNRKVLNKLMGGAKKG